MSKDRLGEGNCYICKAPLAPLVSICWACGYSQLPNPQGEGPSKDGPPAKPPAQDTVRSELQARIDQAKADVKSHLKKK